MKDLLKNMFLLYQKAAPTLKDLWKIHLQEYGSSLKTVFPLISVIVSSSRENSEQHNSVSSRQKKLVSTSQNKWLSEQYVPVEEETASAGSSWLLSEKMEGAGFN